jgi:hypothetical protein
MLGEARRGRMSETKMVIAVDPHKASWTAAAVDHSLRVLGAVRGRFPEARWAIEGASGLGRRWRPGCARTRSPWWPR